MTAENQNIKRIQPYPIHAEVFKVEGQPGFKAEIAKLTDFGFLAKVDMSHYYKVGENYQVRFFLPLSSSPISSPVKVVKTYDALDASQKTEKIKLYTIEMHFTNLSEKDKIYIQQFLAKIGQAAK